MTLDAADYFRWLAAFLDENPGLSGVPVTTNSAALTFHPHTMPIPVVEQQKLAQGILDALGGTWIRSENDRLGYTCYTRSGQLLAQFDVYVFVDQLTPPIELLTATLTEVPA